MGPSLPPGDNHTSAKNKIGEVLTAPPVQRRVDLFRKLIKDLSEDPVGDPNIPNVLFETNWADDGAVRDEDFTRQILQSFKTAHVAEWNRLLQSCTSNQCELLQKFTDNGKLEDIARDVDFDVIRGSRRELQDMESAGQVQLPPPHGAERRRRNWLGSFKGTLSKLSFLCCCAGRCFARPEEVDIVLITRRTYIDARFTNWGRTIEDKPIYTCFPTTSFGVQQIVQYAIKSKLGVRVSGYRHSWSPIFTRATGCILISTLDLRRATIIPNVEALTPVCPALFQGKSTKLNSITEIGPLKEDPTKSLVRVGCATTNEQFRSWCIASKRLTLPLNVIMVEITFGGSNAPICHGAGIKHQTLSDLVYAIEYVDANAKIQKITRSDGDFLSAASGCFGLIGVVTHITLIVDQMTYAIMRPKKLPAIDAIPPPERLRSRVPPALYQDRTPEAIQRAQEEFERRATHDYYTEWFWFPYADEVWVNTWSTTTDSSDVKEYPSKIEIATQWLQAIAMEAAQDLARDTKTEDLLPMLRTSLVSRLAMASLPAEEEIKTWLPDALHFRRAIQNTRVRDLEVEIPLPPGPDDANKPDFSIIQHAWWEAIIKAYEHTKNCPMRMPLEMRIMGDSNVVMAPQCGNKLGTCAIEVLTLQSVAQFWDGFAQEVLDEWMKLRQWKGQELNIRPHWAKEWCVNILSLVECFLRMPTSLNLLPEQSISPRHISNYMGSHRQQFTVRGKPFQDYLKNECYRDAIPKFNGILDRIGKQQHWERSDLKRMFSNLLFDDLVFDDIH
ncbi:hypothetical protein BDV23DRAFT_184867 [Aspergillus alliaceus]|uniref:FAD-binding PCMH-type domain-containing protein n=1 Tax=Petromyces alliaceus TaxID=209559 RepID=A0A5N7C581_PETAA|nr:hypothetical protein BDV23DRAFT_184867 [Aspergillus alliaceus]